MITQEKLKELLDYSPDTGLFTWLASPSRKIVIGSTAGSFDNHGYIVITINCKKYKAHRLAWLFVYGEWPDQIDHIYGNKWDNRIFKLRSVSKTENQRNKKIPKNNLSGVIGVHFNSISKRWVAQIRLNRKTKYLGSSIYKFDAICARKSAENKYGFHENHGRCC